VMTIRGPPMKMKRQYSRSNQYSSTEKAHAGRGDRARCR
jgi:hypothetical protein